MDLIIVMVVLGTWVNMILLKMIGFGVDRFGSLKAMFGCMIVLHLHLSSNILL